MKEIEFKYITVRDIKPNMHIITNTKCWCSISKDYEWVEKGSSTIEKVS